MSEQDYTCVASVVQPLKRKPKLNTQIFIERAKAIHGNKYNYSLVDYKGHRIKVKIFCNACNEYFEQPPRTHMNGSGCAKCGIKSNASQRTKSKEEFIIQAKKVHGDKFDYSKSEYIKRHVKIDIICNDCGRRFLQHPTSHLAGRGCPYCAGKVSPTQQEFIARARLAHGDKYDYQKTIYTKALAKVTITCKEHGDFQIQAIVHTDGRGCKKCTYENKPTTITFSNFLERAVNQHGNKYVYDEKSYQSIKHKVRINCPIHGWFEQSAQTHSRGHGCVECGREHFGFNKTSFIRLCKKNNNGNGLLYLIKCYNKNEVFYKIGITSRTVKQRFSLTFPYRHKEVLTIKGKADKIFELEKDIHRMLLKHKYTPNHTFSGSLQECFIDIPNPVFDKLIELAK